MRVRGDDGELRPWHFVYEGMWIRWVMFEELLKHEPLSIQSTGVCAPALARTLMPSLWEKA